MWAGNIFCISNQNMLRLKKTKKEYEMYVGDKRERKEQKQEQGDMVNNLKLSLCFRQAEGGLKRTARAECHTCNTGTLLRDRETKTEGEKRVDGFTLRLFVLLETPQRNGMIYFLHKHNIITSTSLFCVVVFL